MSASDKYNKEKRKTLTLHFYNKDAKYVDKLSDIPGDSNVKKIMYLIDYYKHSSTPKDTKRL